MPKFQFLATLTVSAPSEAAAQTQADHAIEDADQYLSEDYRLERSPETTHEQLKTLATAAGLATEASMGTSKRSRYVVELTTEGWQIKDNVEGVITASVFGSERAASAEAEAWNSLDDAEGQGRR